MMNNINDMEQLISKVRKLLEKISELKEQKEITDVKLQASEEKFDSLSQLISDPMFISDEQNIISYWNDAAVQFFGYTSEEASGRNLKSSIKKKVKRKQHSIVTPQL